MAHDHSDRCEELQKALADARASQTPPQRDVTIVGVQAARSLDPGDIGPNASPEVAEQIRVIEQELRDMGCEPR